MSKSVNTILSVDFRLRVRAGGFQLRLSRVAKWVVPLVIAAIKLIAAHVRHGEA